MKARQPIKIVISEGDIEASRGQQCHAWTCIVSQSIKRTIGAYKVSCGIDHGSIYDVAMNRIYYYQLDRAGKKIVLSFDARRVIKPGTKFTIIPVLHDKD